MTTQEGQFGVDIARLIELLGVRLYKDPMSALREIIQNSHDACHRRPKWDKRKSMLTFDIDGMDIVIHDNGVGMTRDELIQYFSTIGKSLTGALKKGEEEINEDEKEMLIGEYGIGLLAGFIIAERIIVKTKSINPNSIGLVWESDGRNDYTIREGDVRKPGTELRITVKKKYNRILRRESLEKEIKKYADFLNIDLVFNEEQSCINRRLFPWEDQSKEVDSYLSSMNLTKKSLGIITLKHRGEFLLDGILYIPTEESKYYGGNFGKIDLYVSRMYVNKNTSLLPEWAKFTSGIIECPSLKLTLSREDILEDDISRKIKDFISQRIIDYLDNLQKTTDGYGELMDIVMAHGETLIYAITRNGNLFNTLKDVIPFKQTGGAPLSICEYLRNTNDRKTIYYTKISNEDKIENSMDNLLLRIYESERIPVILINSYFQEEYLRQYARLDKLRIVKTDGGVYDLFRTPQESYWGQVEYEMSTLCQKDVQIRSFSPSHISSLWIDKKFILNARNPLVENMRKRMTEKQAIVPVLNTLLSFSRLLSGDELSTDETFKICTQSIETLQYVLDRFTNPKHRVLDQEIDFTKVFIGMPFSDGFQDDYELGIKPVLEEFGLKAWKADNVIGTGNIFDKIHSAIRMCGRAIINISSNNPNVMFELGIAFGIGKEVLMVKNKNTQCLTNLVGREYVEYSRITELKEKVTRFFEDSISSRKTK